jgi:DoxX-like family
MKMSTALAIVPDVSVPSAAGAAAAAPISAAPAAPPAPTAAAPAISKRARWGGRLLSGIPALFLAFDAAIKLADLEPVSESFLRLGMSPSLATTIGLIELACLAIYLLPRTAPLGAVLLTGFLGGAISLHVRLGDPLLSHVLFPSYLGALLWLGLYLRDPRLPALLRAPDRR